MGLAVFVINLYKLNALKLKMLVALSYSRMVETEKMLKTQDDPDKLMKIKGEKT
jgi:hypothetical protein